MNISIPSASKDLHIVNLTGNAAFPHNISIHTENNPINDISGFKVAILGVPDGRNSPDQGSSMAPDAIRDAAVQSGKNSR